MYYKGSWMLHTLRNVISNDSLWFRIIEGLATEFRISPLNSRLVIDYINRATGENYDSFFKQYLSCASIPQLEYYFTDREHKDVFFYRWKACTPSFNMPLSVEFSGKEQKINPTSAWKQMDVTPGSSLYFKVPEDRFYINVKKIK
jgi:hypothetical protein